MTDDLEKLLALPAEEPLEETWIDKACRENRAACIELSDEERQKLMDVAMAIV